MELLIVIPHVQAEESGWIDNLPSTQPRMRTNMWTVAATQKASRLLKQPMSYAKWIWSGPCQPWYFPRWVLVKPLSGWHAVKEASKHSFVECCPPGSSALQNSQWGNPPSKLTHKSLFTLNFNIWGRFFRIWCCFEDFVGFLVVQKVKNLPARWDPV